jgi:hypothetical protein
MAVSVVFFALSGLELGRDQDDPCIMGWSDPLKYTRDPHESIMAVRRPVPNGGST